jgi:hypothetical protein
MPAVLSPGSLPEGSTARRSSVSLALAAFHTTASGAGSGWPPPDRTDSIDLRVRRLGVTVRSLRARAGA